MKNVFILILLLAALAGGAYFLVSAPSGDTIKTSIAVIEGLVGLSNFDETGRPVFQKTLKDGESATVFSHPKALMDDLALAAPNVMTLIYEEMESDPARLPQGRFTRLFTEEDFRLYIAPALGRRMSLSDIHLSIGPGGFRGSATKKVRGLPVPLKVRGRVAVDKQNNGGLYLELDEVSVGLITLPASARTRLELDFQLHLFERPLVKIIDIEYAGEAVFVTCQRSA